MHNTNANSNAYIFQRVSLKLQLIVKQKDLHEWAVVIYHDEMNLKI